MKKRLGLAMGFVAIILLQVGPSFALGDEPPPGFETWGLDGLRVISNDEGSRIRGAGGAFSFGDMSGFTLGSFSSGGGFLWSGSSGLNKSDAGASSATFVGWGAPLTFRVDSGGRSFRASLGGGTVGAGGALAF